VSKRELWVVEVKDHHDGWKPAKDTLGIADGPHTLRHVRYVPAEEIEHHELASRILRLMHETAQMHGLNDAMNAWLKRDRELGKDGE